MLDGEIPVSYTPLLHTNQTLHINSAAGYWSAFRAVLHTAYRDRKIKENPNGFLDRIECIPTMREHLSQEELIRLALGGFSGISDFLPLMKFSCLRQQALPDVPVSYTHLDVYKRQALVHGYPHLHPALWPEVAHREPGVPLTAG